MPRLVKRKAQKPQKVCDKFICMCGLSQDQPFCDGSHQNTKGESKDQYYVYTKEGKRKKVHFQSDPHQCSSSS